MSIRIDYHTHHERCGHAVGGLEDYVRQAIATGLHQIGLSDHMPLLHVKPHEYYPGMAMAMDELPRYVEEALALKEKYKGDIDIRVGMEGDYIEGCEEKIAELIDSYPWDYVIGSVHFLGTWDITDFRQTGGWEMRDPMAVYERYYDAVGKAARSGLYDYIGHIDVIKRFGFRPQDDVTRLEDAALEAVREADLAIELNASGLRMPCAEMFPGPRMLKKACELGIPVTLGSDCHQPERLEQYLPEARMRLKEAGYGQLATFQSRKRLLIDF